MSKLGDTIKGGSEGGGKEGSRRPIAEWIARVGVVRDKSVRAAFVCLQGQGVQGQQGTRRLGHWTLGWPAHLLLQGSIILPAGEARENFKTQMGYYLGTKGSDDSWRYCWCMGSRLAGSSSPLCWPAGLPLVTSSPVRSSVPTRKDRQDSPGRESDSQGKVRGGDKGLNILPLSKSRRVSVFSCQGVRGTEVQTGCPWQEKHHHLWGGESWRSASASLSLIVPIIHLHHPGFFVRSFQGPLME